MASPFTPFEINLMEQLLQLSESKKGVSAPNPPVACAIVKDQKILAQTVHEKAGTPHAEVLALKEVGDAAVGATAYITLEPCTHVGKTPACSSALIEAGITRVVYPFEDPNPIVRQRPAKDVLSAHGVDVQTGLLRDKALLSQDIYLTNIVKHRPFVSLKTGMSLDGKIALSNGDSKYITSEGSRNRVHQYRREHNGILVGIDTVLADDPQLTVRFDLLTDTHQNPQIIILDTHLKTPPTARLFQNRPQGDIHIMTTADTLKTYSGPLTSLATLHGVLQHKRIDSWSPILDTCYQAGIYSILIEGGQGVYTSAIEAGCVDQVLVFIAPKLLVSGTALSPFASQEDRSLRDALSLTHVQTESLSPDTLIRGYLHSPVQVYQGGGS